MRILISTEDRVRLRHVLDAALPQECCGALLGTLEGSHMRVHGVLPMLNTATELGGFSISASEIRRARLAAARRGEDIVALFHSHPGGPTSLSEADRDSLQYSEWPWVIISQGATASEIQMECHAIHSSSRCS